MADFEIVGKPESDQVASGFANPMLVMSIAVDHNGAAVVIPGIPMKQIDGSPFFCVGNKRVRLTLSDTGIDQLPFEVVFDSQPFYVFASPPQQDGFQHCYVLAMIQGLEKDELTSGKVVVGDDSEDGPVLLVQFTTAEFIRWLLAFPKARLPRHE